MGTRHGPRRLPGQYRPRRLARERVPQHRDRGQAQGHPRLRGRTPGQGRRPHRFRTPGAGPGRPVGQHLGQRAAVGQRCPTAPVGVRRRRHPRSRRPTGQERRRETLHGPRPHTRNRTREARRPRGHRSKPADVSGLRVGLHRIPHEGRRRSPPGAGPERRHHEVPTQPPATPCRPRPAEGCLRHAWLQPHPRADPPHDLLVPRRTHRPRPPHRTLRPMPHPPAPRHGWPSAATPSTASTSPTITAAPSARRRRSPYRQAA